jgi:hypothetical protein
MGAAGSRGAGATPRPRCTPHLLCLCSLAAPRSLGSGIQPGATLHRWRGCGWLRLNATCHVHVLLKGVRWVGGAHGLNDHVRLFVVLLRFKLLCPLCVHLV